MSTEKHPSQWANDRIEEFATEFEHTHNEFGNDLRFGLPYFAPSSQFMRIWQEIMQTCEALPVSGDVACELAPQDAALIRRAARYPFVYLVEIQHAALLNGLLFKAGLWNEANGLWRNVKHLTRRSQTEPEGKQELQDRADCERAKLEHLIAPYRAKATKILKGDVDVYATQVLSKEDYSFLEKPYVTPLSAKFSD